MPLTQPDAILSPNQKLKPDWAGEDILSRFVNLLIQTKPIYSLMKRALAKIFCDMIGSYFGLNFCGLK